MPTNEEIMQTRRNFGDWEESDIEFCMQKAREDEQQNMIRLLVGIPESNHYTCMLCGRFFRIDQLKEHIPCLEKQVVLQKKVEELRELK